jgi:hypothetical protein
MKRATGGLVNTQQRANRTGFARPIGAQKGEHLTWIHIKTKMRNNLFIANGKAKVFDANEG